MSQGVVDCTMISATELTNLQLFDVTKYITINAPGGSFSGVGAMNINLDRWQDLGAERRAQLIKLAPFNSAAITVNYETAAAASLVKAAEMGIEIIEPSADMRTKTEAFVMQDLALIKSNFTDDYGLNDVDSKVEIIIGLIEKWKGITATIYDDKEAMTNALDAEVFSKIDAATYFVE
ncbi:hypothetical protein [Profundibacter sp.]